MTNLKINHDIHETDKNFYKQMMGTDTVPSLTTQRRLTSGLCWVDRLHLESLLAFVHRGVEEGATLLCGGRRLDRKGEGTLSLLPSGAVIKASTVEPCY